MVSMMILVEGASSLMARQASIPDVRGIRTSIRTMSGNSSSVRRIASTPSPASPTMAMSDSWPRTSSRPRLYRTWSSATRTLMGSPGAPDICGPCAAASPIVVTRTSWHADGLRAPYDLPARCPHPCEAVSGDAFLLLRHVQMDHAIGPTAPTVDNAWLVGVLVMEKVEVVSDELHLVERLVQTHGRAGVDLLTHMNG